MIFPFWIQKFFSRPQDLQLPGFRPCLGKSVTYQMQVFPIKMMYTILLLCKSC